MVRKRTRHIAGRYGAIEDEIVLLNRVEMALPVVIGIGVLDEA
jgi:hypothetical protein